MILVSSGRHPLAIFLLVACVLTGVAGLLSPVSTSPTVAHLLAPWELEAWYSGLILSGGATLVGVMATGLSSLLIERVGLVVLASLSGMYAAAIAIQGHTPLTFAAAFTGAFALGCVGRVVQINGSLRKLPGRGGDR
jgi:hypothetical protein